jgi:DNA gyrase subunit A
MVQRTSVRGINRYGRASQGVRLMNLRDDDVVSAVALVAETDAVTAAPVIDGELPPEALGDDGVVSVEPELQTERDGESNPEPDGEADGAFEPDGPPADE